MDQINRTCVCDDGWDSALNWHFPFVTTVPIHMCTVETLHANRYYKHLPTLLTFDCKNIVSFTQQYRYVNMWYTQYNIVKTNIKIIYCL